MRRIGASNKKSKNSSAVASDDASRDKVRSRTVLVGIKPDAASRELLTWALVKLAKPDDCVIAVHVVPPPSLSSCSAFDSSGKEADLLQSILSVYSGFCILKQIDLKLKVCSGSRIVLVGKE